MDIAITGSSGLIGTVLKTKLKAEGHNPIPVSRKGGNGISWDPAKGTIDANAFEGMDAVVHLAGEPIGDKRWTDAQRARIMDSRKNGTTLLSDTLAGLQKPPKVFLSGSAIGWYGDRGDEVLTEESTVGSGWVTDVVVEWEKATASAEAAGIRVAHLRTGIVLSTEGGAMGKLIPLFKFGLGGKMGSGKQWMSWISIDDEVAIISWLLDNELSGPINLTAPNPVTNAQFTKTLGSAMKRPTFLPIPEFGPKLLVGADRAQALLFDSARILPSVLTDAGYSFIHPTLESALGDLLAKEEHIA